MTQLADRLLGSGKAPGAEKAQNIQKKSGKVETVVANVGSSSSATTPAFGLTEGVAKVTPEADEMPLDGGVASVSKIVTQ